MQKVAISLGLFVFLLSQLGTRFWLTEHDCSARISIRRLEKIEGGWDTTFIKKASVLRRDPYIANGYEGRGFVAVQYGLERRPITIPLIEVNSCERTATLSNHYLLPDRVFGIEKKSRVFAYFVFGQIVSGPEPSSTAAGATMNVVFYDMKGTGIYDVVEIAVGPSLTFVPTWVE